VEYRIGCSGWNYSAWLGHFYPPNLEAGKFLPYYSKVFDTVEIDSSFYRTPNVFMTGKWSRSTPDNFRFTAKLPKSLTHDRRLAEPEKDLPYWFKSFEPLKQKIASFLIQLPPSLSMKEGFKKLQYLLGELDYSYRYAIEFRHKSWFNDEVYRLLKEHKICFVWSVLEDLLIPAETTTDFIYLRFIGDRSIDEKDFGIIKKDRTKETRLWAGKVKKAGDIPLAIIAANNHFAGFGAATANTFRKMVGLDVMKWDEMLQTRLG